jgi:plasmid maintenance system antidote protein VapI
MKLIAVRDELRYRLREMISSGLTTGSEIANSVGVAQPHICNILHGKRGMSFELADALLEFAQLDVEELIAKREPRHISRFRSKER